MCEKKKKKKKKKKRKKNMGKEMRSRRGFWFSRLGAYNKRSITELIFEWATTLAIC